MTTYAEHATVPAEDRGEPLDRREALDRRLEEIGWGLLLIMTGSVWLVPWHRVPRGSWLLGTGVLLLGLNGYRMRRGIRIHPLSAVLGALALAAGIGELLAVEVPVFALGLVAVGAWLVLQPLASRRDPGRAT